MNVVPMFLNLILPWGAFVIVCGICSSWMMYTQPGAALSIVAFVFGLWALSVVAAVRARKGNPEPTWFSYAALMVGIAVISGTACGLTNYSIYKRPYYAIHDLKTMHHVNAGTMRGQNMMDVGIMHFTEQNQLDGLKSWHFKHGTLYCVAPVVSNGSAPETQSYDFWAVGQECCSLSSSDFRCGSWGSVDAHSAIRLLDDEAAPYYRLAVKQAETMYGIVANHPIFFEWTVDPEYEVNAMNKMAFKHFLLMAAVAFVASLFCVVMATCKFSWIGRGGAMEVYGDLEWQKAGQGRLPQLAGGAYGGARA